MSRIGRALAEPPEHKPTAEDLLAALPVTEELKVIRHRLAEMWPVVAEDIEQYLTDYVLEMEYGP